MPTKINAKVKMFRVGELGDCFLLTFKQGNRKSNVLIDCGSFRNSNRSKARLNDIAKEIKEILGRDKIDLVVGTHQHNDHYSGFLHAKEVFESMNIEKVCLSWLDDPLDPLAQKIQEKHKKLRLTLLAIREELDKSSHQGAQKLKEDFDSFVDFHEDVEDESEEVFAGNGQTRFAATQKPSTTDKALEVLKSLGEVEYLSPGTIFDLPGIYNGGVKVYVLGPPRDYKRIKDTKPNAGESYDRHLADLGFMADSFLNTLQGADEVREERNYPFNRSFKKSLSELEKNYAGLIGRYQEEEWQNIDDEWLKVGENLALHLNSYTNNTSLVLAFELVFNEKVLLFVGDAQTGNWLSWKEVPWEDQQDHFDHLISHTVLYKVGHHGSHNATLKDTMEAMTHPELVALIPVDDSDPNLTKEYHPWRMPAENLYERLIEKTQGRVLRMDHGKIEYPENHWAKEPRGEELFWEYELE
jgi:beta-lactamase superfamily II metal-dependent hydrolase